MDDNLNRLLEMSMEQEVAVQVITSLCCLGTNSIREINVISVYLFLFYLCINYVGIAITL